MRKGVTDNMETIQDILSKTDVLWLALYDEGGPYSVPVNFAEENGIIYIHSGKRGRKYEALMTGTPVAFSAAKDMEPKHGDSACAFGYRFRSVMGKGTPRALEGEDKSAALSIITVKFAGREMPFNEKALEATAAFAIDVESIHARIKE
ncbi:pyridoxamine 5'-phosphate oxidase family protein [uncultured Pseudodesulfovibrio sp.]|uniref:pyridoxamine 5'-phosphate oxidase family protein n=1 Tax=uncultured Pseudodesulfovibrio sp. TaxID=2035858 RepID=UPI0029C65CAF|nr:pyridoxamine 5'-phosphate oxidase family protein [uncultured Pseudodesulfovibrio sp.]